jgi:SAM-dependent methyltransferase
LAGIDYSHEDNLHTVCGARAALGVLFEASLPSSILDVGCGTGVWLRAALELGISDIYGIDGVTISEQNLRFPSTYFRRQDLRSIWDLGRRFEIVLCLEVAEHLLPEAAPCLIASLVQHSELIIFSAAAPAQAGQHHVNCQWPSYWQKMFNSYGYSCDDAVRWRLWENQAVEPWYRQNMFIARYAPAEAGHEPRIRSVIHPKMLERKAFDLFSQERAQCMSQIESGLQPISWYLYLLPRAVFNRLKRTINDAKIRVKSMNS